MPGAAGGGSRRIIYIKNPSSGSHFRNIGGSKAGAPPSQPKQPGAPKIPKAPNTPEEPDYAQNGTGQANGYLPGYHAPANWWISSPDQDAPNYGGYDGPVIMGAYEQQFTPTFTPAETLLGEAFDIFTGVDPATGNVLPPYGTPGQLKYLSGGFAFDIATEGGRENITFGGPFAHIPYKYWGKAPNRNQKRPWWAK